MLLVSGDTSTMISPRGGLAKAGGFTQKRFFLHGLATKVRDTLAPLERTLCLLSPAASSILKA